MNVVLVGARGCGKTTIGKRLADRLWQTYIDIDEMIVRNAGKNIKEIFEEDGEAHFREIETACLRECLQVPDTVIGLGGGTVTIEVNRTLLKESGAKVIYLKCEPEELHKRIEADPQSPITRPPLTHLGGGIEEVKLLLERREPYYRDVMTSELEVTNLTPAEAVVYISRML
jgi:shikimate kinase